jgi:hypothetical protein
VTPVPLDLPIRPPEAAELARLIFQQAEGKRLSDDVRGRIASRAAQLRLETMRPYFGSLAREPVHHGTYYLAVEGIGGAPLLLHIAPPSAPTSGIFEKPLLIGRFADVVLNAIPFGPGDAGNIAAFVARIDSAFAPRPQGGRAAIAVAARLPETFDAFRAVLRRTGKNLASACGVDVVTAQWSAIRSGWREGYSAVGEDPACTHFVVETADAEEAGRRHELVRQARAAVNLARPFDFELSFAAAPVPTTGDELRAVLAALKDAGHAPQWVSPRLEGLGRLEELAGVARLFQCGISIAASPEHDAAALDTIARATAGRFFYKVCANTEDAAARVEFIAAHLA